MGKTIAGLLVALLAVPALAQGLPEALEAIQGYEFGQSRVALDKVAELVVATVDTPQQSQAADQLVEALGGNGTLEAKRFILRQLNFAVTTAQVDDLAPLLLDEDLSDMVRYAIQPLAGPEVDKALLGALKYAPDDAANIQIGIMTSLGARETAKAVSALRKYALSDNADVANAAVSALGRIGGKKAARALAAAKKSGAPAVQEKVSECQILVADKMRNEGDLDRAEDIYEELVSSSEPAAIRKAAFLGLIRTGGLDDDPMAWHEELKSDPVLREAAATYLRRVAQSYERLAEQLTAK